MGPWPAQGSQRTCRVRGPGLCTQLHITQAEQLGGNLAPGPGSPGCGGVCLDSVSRSLLGAGHRTAALLTFTVGGCNTQTSSDNMSSYFNSRLGPVRGPVVKDQDTALAPRPAPVPPPGPPGLSLMAILGALNVPPKELGRRLAGLRSAVGGTVATGGLGLQHGPGCSLAAPAPRPGQGPAGYLFCL